MVAGTVIFTDTLMVVFTATFIVRLQEVDEGAGAEDTEIGLDYPTEVSSFTAVLSAAHNAAITLVVMVGGWGGHYHLDRGYHRY